MTQDAAEDPIAATLDVAKESIIFARTLKLETRLCAMLFHKKHATAVKKKKIEDALTEFQGHELDASTHCHPKLWEAAQILMKGNGGNDEGADEPPMKKQKKASKAERAMK